jgi:glycosyltransferase involved in cell wall biosynthesis
VRNVLFVAYDFPPCANIGGSLRSERFVHYLPEFGWHPAVIALGPATGAERFPDVHRVRSLTPWRRPYALSPYGWCRPLARRARALLAERAFDAIYASCPPFAHASTLVRVAARTKLPLLLDFRDTWALNPYVAGSRPNRLFHRYVVPAQEARVLASAQTLVLNTPSALAAYGARYPELKSRFALIPNGYDEADFAEAVPPPASATGALTLVHLGRFGISGRRADALLEALASVTREGRDVRLRLVGEDSAASRDRARALGIAERVDFMAGVPHRRALEELQRADVVVLYQEAATGAVSAVAGKTHEYLRAGKPILAIAPKGDNLDLVQAMGGCAKLVVQPASGAEIADAMRQFADLKQAGRLPARAPAEPEYLREYSRRRLTERLAGLLDALVAAPASAGNSAGRAGR